MQESSIYEAFLIEMSRADTTHFLNMNPDSQPFVLQKATKEWQRIQDLIAGQFQILFITFKRTDFQHQTMWCFESFSYIFMYVISGHMKGEPLFFMILICQFLYYLLYTLKNSSKNCPIQRFSKLRTNKECF